MSSRPTWLLAILVLIVAAGSWRAHAQAAPAEELALRLLGGLDGQASTLALVPGALPDDGPVILAWPDDTRLVGSMVRRDPEDAIIEFTVVIDSPLPAREAAKSFQRALLDAGWREWLPPQPLGFAPSPVLYTAVYCAAGDSDFLYLSALQTDATHTDVRLEFFADTGYSPCLGPDPLGDAEPPTIPILLPPNGSEIVNFGSQQVLIDQLSTSALITTGMSQAELFGHYEAQLQEAGWQRVTRGESGTRDYSRWTLLDDREQVWTSLLSVVEIVEDPGRFFVAVVVLVPAAAEGTAVE